MCYRHQKIARVPDFPSPSDDVEDSDDGDSDVLSGSDDAATTSMAMLVDEDEYEVEEDNFPYPVSREEIDTLEARPWQHQPRLHTAIKVIDTNNDKV